MAKQPAMDQLHELLEDLEAIAEEVLCDRQEIISLDKRRNTNREALRALQKTFPAKPLEADSLKLEEARKCTSLPIQHASVNSSQAWMCIGDMFVSMPKTFLVNSIEKEQKQMDKAINELRDGMRKKVDTLRHLEGEESTRGSLLKPLSKEEWAGVEQVVAWTK
ncbi:hypothetical protein FHG87_003052 [Trinorchestia longiramus]|nr:hypothetical protein FHG87_003052 [Trinorchestia longiramus]